MATTFKGRPILPGNVRGEAVVSRQGFNTLACFRKSMALPLGKAVCADQDNPDLFGKVLTGKVICLPQTIGSTSGGLILEAMAALNLGPMAMLFSEQIDSLAASGLILADVWVERRIVTVDRLGEAFLEAVRHGQPLDIAEDGTVTLL